MHLGATGAAGAAKHSGTIGGTVARLAVDAGHALLASFFSWMTTRQSGPVGFSLGGFAVQVLLTGAGAFALYPVLRKVDPASERPEIGALR